MIKVWAVDKNGDGYSQVVATFDDLEDIELRVSHFAKDVVLKFEEYETQ